MWQVARAVSDLEDISNVRGADPDGLSSLGRVGSLALDLAKVLEEAIDRAREVAVVDTSLEELSHGLKGGIREGDSS